MKPPCNHPENDRTIVVIEAVLGCETTRVFCKKCKQFLTPPETNC